MPHRLRPLAHSRTCQIDHCVDCNILHVTVGPLTMRLELSAAQQLRHTLAEALERLGSAHESSQATSDPALIN